MCKLGHHKSQGNMLPATPSQHACRQLPLLGVSVPAQAPACVGACRLRRWVPQAKVIMLLREPVTRALSNWYNHYHRNGGIGNIHLGRSRSFDEFIYNELLQNKALRCQLGLS